MFKNILATQLKLGLRNKSNIFWTLMFPVILGTLFYVAFGNVYENFSSDPIKTAVVFDTENEEIIENTKTFLTSLRMNDHEMLEIEYTDYEKGLELLKDGEKVNGIITVKDSGNLELAINSNGVYSTIQANVVNIYNQNLELVQKVAGEHPEKLNEVLDSITDRAEFINSHNMSGDNKDPFVTYFYNLLAMTALFAALNSVRIGNNCQANMSPIGARTNASPLNRMTFQFAGLVASFVVQAIVMILGITYLIFILKIDFGGDIPLIYLTGVLATLVGVSLGFFVGNIGSFAMDKKESILVAVTLTGCALSGLMYGDIKVIITESCPIVNRINPAAVISDAFYCLNMFGARERYLETVLYMIVISAVLMAAGLFLGRRNHYDSV